jgi:tocopherol cyclase
MAISKENARNNAYKLKGSLKKNGFDRWRFFFYGQAKNSGEQRCFYIELYILNPLVSPDMPFFGCIPDAQFPNRQIQQDMPLDTDKDKSEENTVLSSYVVLRAGELGRTSKQVNSFFPADDLLLNKKQFGLKIGNSSISNNLLEGSVFLDPHEKLEHPEYFSDAGLFSWKLKYEKQMDFRTGYSKKNYNWIPTGAKTVYAGTFSVDGEDFIVSPTEMTGYADKNWGKNFTQPWFHLSSANLVSTISGKKLQQSCFAIQGIYEKKLCILADLEGQKMEFIPGNLFHNYTVTWSCSEAPADSEGKKLHWSVSVHDSHCILDVDIFCKVDELYAHDYEIPSRKNKRFKVLSGGTGTGEIRFYRCINKGVELIEHAHIVQALCEYGAE